MVGILFSAIEKLKGGPVSERVQDYSYRIGSIVLVLLMGLALSMIFPASRGGIGRKNA